MTLLTQPVRVDEQGEKRKTFAFVGKMRDVLAAMRKAMRQTGA